MKEETATVFKDLHEHRHLVREKCALANLGYRVHDLVKQRARTEAQIECTVETACLLAVWLRTAPLEFITIVEEYVRESAGEAALPEWLKERKDG